MTRGYVPGGCQLKLNHITWTGILDLDDSSLEVYHLLCLTLWEIRQEGQIRSATRNMVTRCLGHLTSNGSLKVTRIPPKLFGLNYWWRWVYFMLKPSCCDMRLFNYPRRLFETAIYS